MDPPDRMSAVLRDRWLLGLMAAGLSLRLVLALVLHPDLVPKGDEGAYLHAARAIAATGTLETGSDFVRPPLYFAMLGGAAALLGKLSLPWVLVVRLLQCVLGVLTAVPVYRSTRRIADRRAALLAAAFLLFDPTLIAYSHLIWPETVYLFAAALAFDGAARLDPARPGRSAALGVGLGLAMLLKPVFGLYAAVLCAGWWLRLDARAALRLTLVVAVCATASVAPWVARNVVRYGPAILIENQGPYNLWIGNDPQRPDRVLFEWKRLADPVERSRVGTQRGLAAIANDPRAFLRNGVRRTVNLWGLEFFVVHHLVIGGYGEVSKTGFLTAFYVIQLAHLVALLFAALGVARVAGDPTLRGVLAYAGLLSLVTFATVATTRFRVPFAFPISISAGVGLGACLDRRWDARAWLPLLLAVGLLAVSASRPLFVEIALGRFQDAAQLDTVERRFFRY